MRYIHNKKPKPQGGDKRLRCRFLWLPKRIGNETRWLEHAAWIQYYHTYSENYSWKDLKWHDKKEDN